MAANTTSAYDPNNAQNGYDPQPVGVSGEDRVNALRGYKAAIKNPRVSSPAKRHAQDVIDNELGGDQPRYEMEVNSNPTKETNRVQGGLKAATKNPRVSDDAKQSAEERLAQMSNRINEQPDQPEE